MNSVLVVFPVVLLLLACPLMMFGMPVGMWLMSRMKGEKKPLSMSCMPGHENSASQPSDVSSDSQLRERVSQMEQEISALHAQLQDGSGDGANGREERIPSRHS